MIEQIFIGLSMIAATFGCAAALMLACAEFLRWLRRNSNSQKLFLNQVFALTTLATWLAVNLLIAMAAWAKLLTYIDVFPSFSDGLYFSMIAFTTLGFGDVILPPDWQLLSGFIAIDGFLLFGMATAFLFEVSREFYEDREMWKQNATKFNAMTNDCLGTNKV
ncbi:potassium channel family protein [Kordiimonas sp. SCSIO 12610]|uniref:potassium channel family protein n=1 Tax=Kordiimonas sp. SCSIO 12610 TaxID=2829597 RepID=UPI002108C907|nr:potassium channel family protein [Kordiimonas sp. SCSIO 12610]UTW55652.1 two pore domain potassium channel family protein [Kordiimonas sp. SCSIO 12610]